MSEQVEWAVRHSQGIYEGRYGFPLTEKQARAWMADDIARDHRRQSAYRGRQRLLRRTVTPWVEIDTATKSTAEETS